MKPASRPSNEPRRQSSTPHYQTFPTKPPTSRGQPPTLSPDPDEDNTAPSDTEEQNYETPLPKKQLAVLAFVALAEQTALNSISPYLPDMASTFPEVSEEKVGLYVGLIASSFALAQFATNFFWGWASDRIGRKPVILLGTICTAACFVAFGFSRTLWQAVLAQVFMGLLNGNQGVVSTCLGEITDRRNQSRAFTYLPVVYGLGAITGPAIGGLLVNHANPFKNGGADSYPYLLPNLVSAGVLVLDFVVAAFFLEESLDEAKDLPPLGKRVESLFSWLWQFTSASRPTYTRRQSSKRMARSHSGIHGDGPEHTHSDTDSQNSQLALFPDTSGENLSAKDVLNRDTLLVLVTYFIFQLSNISFNSLYPIFGQAPPPQGRALNPEEIGLSLSFAGLITILFQVGVYGKLREKAGNRITYRVSLLTFVAAFLLMPWVAYKNPNEGIGLGSGKVLIWVELGFVLIVKTVASVGGLTSALLLITNSSPNTHVLGTLNGLAQTLSAGGRAAGPFVSGALFTASTHVQPKGEMLAFGVFGGIAFVGFLLSFGIRGEYLEAEGWDSSSEDSDEEEHEERNESSRLLR